MHQDLVRLPTFVFGSTGFFWRLKIFRFGFSRNFWACTFLLKLSVNSFWLSIDSPWMDCRVEGLISSMS